MNSRDSLARGVAPAPARTLHARSLTGAIRVPPEADRTVRFGRDGRPEVDLPVGEDDLRVSRRHGEVTYRLGHWWLRNTGRQLIRLPQGRWLHGTTDPVPLATGYTPVFVRGSGFREHLVELYVSDHDDKGPASRRSAETLPPKCWPLDDDERLILVVLGQHYLLYEPAPRPLSYREAAQELSLLRATAWSEKQLQRRVEDVRKRLSRSGDFPYKLLEDERGEHADNGLKHNLLKGLVESTTLVPPDLALLEDDLEDDLGDDLGDAGQEP